MTARRSPATSDVAGVTISHPDRIVYPCSGLTKLDVARYYAAVGEWMLPHVEGRPLTLVHCPQGLAGPCAYLRHSKVWGPKVLRRVEIQEKTKVGTYLVADDVEGLVTLAQMGVLEIHTWNSTATDVERPNRIIWDLDPGPNVTWPQTVEAARTVRDALQALGLESWVKTTGGRGVHVVVPIARHLDWSECLAFSRGVAEVITRSAPDRYTTTFAKAGRESRILIDYLRNNRTNTSVVAYSTRARPGGAVSMPVRWSELTARLRPDAFTMMSVPARLSRRGSNPWEEYWKRPQRVSAAARRAVLRRSG
jgi:bifunctional non-homologous end joining protein LigD